MLQMLLYSERNTLSLLFKWAGEAINTYHHRAVDLFNTKTICGWVPNWNLLKSKTTQLLINSKCHPPSVSPPPWVKFYKTMFWEVDKKWCGVNMKSWEGETRLQLCNNDENGSAAGLPLGSWPSVTAGLWQTEPALLSPETRPARLDGSGWRRPQKASRHRAPMFEGQLLFELWSGNDRLTASYLPVLKQVQAIGIIWPKETAVAGGRLLKFLHSRVYAAFDGKAVTNLQTNGHLPSNLPFA